MIKDATVRSYLDFVLYESERRRRSSARPYDVHPPVITISRQAGAGSNVVARELVARLERGVEPGAPPWTVFDRDLIDRVLADHDLPAQLARSMPEDRVSATTETVDEVLGIHPPTSVLVRKTAETILRLAEIGDVIVVGRGGSVITARLGYAFHVRLVGSVERRIEHVQENLRMDADAARDYVGEHDLGRRRYVKKYYRRDIEDPLLYHLVINTDRVPYAEAAAMIAEAVAARHAVASGAARRNGHRART
jgi:cytidylate kinase-like protein